MSDREEPPAARYMRPRWSVGKWHRLRGRNRHQQSTWCGTSSYPPERRDWTGPGGPRKTDRCRTCETLWTRFVAMVEGARSLRRVMERAERQRARR